MIRPQNLLIAFLLSLLCGCGGDDRPTWPSPPEYEPRLFSIYRTHWGHASMPVGIDTALSERAHVAWYNPFDRVPVTEIWNQDLGTGQPSLTYILKIHFKPVDHKYIRDTINNIIDSASVAVAPERSWAGFMAPYLTAPNESTIPFPLPDGDVNLEIRLRGDADIVMHLDIGRISEDIDGDGIFDNEDLDGFGILDDHEDVGLDGLPDQLEFGYDLDNGVTDPAGDNFSPDIENPANIWRINGTEGNFLDADGGWLPDTEDRDWNGLETINSYFSYRIDLTDTTGVNSFYVPGSQNEYGWKTIRIPLRSGSSIDTVVGSPSWDDIHDARIWFDSGTTHGMPEEAYVVEIAAFDVTSTGWSTSLYIADSLLGNVRFLTHFVDPVLDERYIPPPPYTPSYRLLTDILPAGKTIALDFRNLHASVPVYMPDSGLILAADTGTAARWFDLIYGIIYDYLWLDAYVWGGVGEDDSIMFFLRVGVAEDHYVQYHTYVKPGWHPENHIHIDLTEAFAMWRQFSSDQMLGLDSSTVRQSGRYLVRSPLDVNFSPHTYTLFRYCAVGVVNLDGSSPASGDVWINGTRLSGQRF